MCICNCVFVWSYLAFFNFLLSVSVLLQCSPTFALCSWKQFPAGCSLHSLCAFFVPHLCNLIPWYLCICICVFFVLYLAFSNVQLALCSWKESPAECSLLSLCAAQRIIVGKTHEHYTDKPALFHDGWDNFLQVYNCVTRAPLHSVRHPWHLTKSPLCAIYKGMNALYWPSIINYQLPPPHSTQHTASSFRNAQLSQLDLV